jgi:hypothetical protein
MGPPNPAFNKGVTNNRRTADARFFIFFPRRRRVTSHYQQPGC